MASCDNNCQHCCLPGYYGNEIDGVVKPKSKGKKGDGDEEETELIHNSSEEEMDDDGDLTSVATTPPMKPVITDRSELKYDCYGTIRFFPHKHGLLLLFIIGCLN